MTIATDIRTDWNGLITDIGNTITLYNPTITYNDEADVTAYTLGTGTSTTAIVLEERGESYPSEIEGIDNRQTIRVLFLTTDAVDNETIIKWGTNYFTVAGGSYKAIKIQDTTIAHKAMMVKMLPQEAAKIA